MKLQLQPSPQNISLIIPPNYSTWETIELSYQCAKYAIDNGIPGDFVECGVAAGNNLAAMCLVGRRGIGYDSFEGIPWAGKNDEYQPGIVAPPDKSKFGILESSGISSHSIEDVKANMKKWNIENYRLVKGWFQETLPFEKIDEISVLRLDGDLYESTFTSLVHLYCKLSKGGILIMDDWKLYGCRKAFSDYFIEEMPELIFDNGVTYWQK